MPGPEQAEQGESSSIAGPPLSPGLKHHRTQDRLGEDHLRVKKNGTKKKTPGKSSKRSSGKEKRKREKNLESLKMSFPHVKKRFAKTSLRLSKNILEGAVVHVDLINGFHEITIQRGANLDNLEGARIDMSHGCLETGIVNRSITGDDCARSKSNVSPPKIKKHALRNRTSGRVGVVIRKTKRSYIATPFENM